MQAELEASRVQAMKDSFSKRQQELGDQHAAELAKVGAERADASQVAARAQSELSALKSDVQSLEAQRDALKRKLVEIEAEFEVHGMGHHLLSKHFGTYAYALYVHCC